MTHKATPEQWAQIEQFVKDCGYDSCLLELRDRIAQIEQQLAALSKDATEPQALAPAGGLVERVAGAIADSDDPHESWEVEARAAILVVAEWLQSQDSPRPAALEIAAAWLREEVKA